MSQYTFQFNDLAAYASAKASGGSIATALSGVSSTDISRSAVSYIKGIGQAVTDSVNLFVPYAKGGLAGDVLYYTGTEYCWLKSTSDALDGSVLGQNIINTSAIPTSWVRVGVVPTSESKDVQIGMQAYQPGAAMVKVEKLLGNSVEWNQLCIARSAFTSTDGAVTLRSNTILYDSTHKYYIAFTATTSDSGADVLFWGGRNAIIYSSRNFNYNLGLVDSLRVSIVASPTATVTRNSFAALRASSMPPEREYGYTDGLCFDLTLMFGESVANTMTVEMFEKLFPLSYYEYNAGGIISNEAVAVKGIGRNLWDGNHSAEGKYLDNSGEEKTGTGNISTYIPVLDGKNYLLFTEENIILGGNASICWYDGNKNFIAGEAYSSSVDMKRTAPTNAKFFRFSQTDPTKHYMFALSGPLNGTYEPYKESIAKLDAKKIYGKLNGTGNYVQVFPNGIRSALTVYDEVDYQSKSAVVRVNNVDLGNLSWALVSSGYFESLDEVTDYKLPASNQAAFENQINAKGYSSAPASRLYNYDKAVAFWQSSKRIGIIDSSYSDAATFKAAMQGVELVYELATPKYYTDLKLSDDNGATFHDLPRPFYYTAGLEMKDPQDTASSVTAPARILASYKPIKK